jgi:hypothetical protein
VSDDSGGYHSHLDHIAGGGLTLDWPGGPRLSADVVYIYRTYPERTPCAAEQRGTAFLGADCQPTSAVATPSRQEQSESTLMVNARGSWPLTSWLAVQVSYELEDADSDLEDPLLANHRLLGGLSWQP